MNFKKTPLLLIAVFTITMADAAKISFSFSPTLTGGTDPDGLANATWLFEFDVTQPTYQLSGSFSDISFASDSAQVTLTGADNSSVNGTHSISSGDASGDFVFIPDFFGSTIFALEGPNNTVSSFSFAGINVSSFGPVGTSFGSPSVGDPVDLAPYNSFTFSSSSMQAGSGTFNFTPTAIPEPGLTVLLVLGTALCLHARRRWTSRI